MTSASSRMLINLVGILAILLVLVLGIMMFAVPQVSAAVNTHRETEAVELQNEAFSTQLTELQIAENSIDELEAETEALRTEIPAEPHLDDVFVTVAAAAATAKVEIMSVSTEDPEPWTPPTADAALALMAGTDPSTTAPDASGEAAVIDGSADDAGTSADGTAPDGSAVDGSADDGAADPTAPAPADRMRIPIIVEVISPNSATATRFIDALANTPRVFSIRDAQVDSETSAHDLYRTTVHFDAFVLVGGQ